MPSSENVSGSYSVYEGPHLGDTVEEALKCMRNNEGPGTLSGMFLKPQCADGDRPFWRYLMTEHPDSKTYVCRYKDSTICGVMITHEQPTDADPDEVRYHRAHAWSKQFLPGSSNFVADVHDEMCESLSPYGRSVWNAAVDICVASFPKTGDEDESQIADALFKALPSDATYNYVGVSSESPSFLRNGFEVLGTRLEYKVPIPSDHPVRLSGAEAKVVFLLKGEKRTSVMGSDS